jgi:thioesterase domain-containing protein
MVFIESVSQPLGREVGARFGWAELANGAFEVRTVPGDHLTLLAEPNVAVLAPELAACFGCYAETARRPG